jgi:hypothetical protein
MVKKMVPHGQSGTRLHIKGKNNPVAVFLSSFYHISHCISNAVTVFLFTFCILYLNLERDKQ